MKGVFIKKEISLLKLANDVKYPRFSYYTIKNHYLKWLDSLANRGTYFDNDYLNWSLGITGLRRTGKTTLLKQLYNELDNTCYIDCSMLSRSDDIEDILDYASSMGVILCLIDELCKLSSDCGVGIECFISAVKIFILMCFLFSQAHLLMLFLVLFIVY